MSYVMYLLGNLVEVLRQLSYDCCNAWNGNRMVQSRVDRVENECFMNNTLVI